MDTSRVRQLQCDDLMTSKKSTGYKYMTSLSGMIFIPNTKKTGKMHEFVQVTESIPLIATINSITAKFI